MYIEIPTENLWINLSQLVAFKAADIPAGATFNNEKLEAPVHTIDFVGSNNQLTIRFADVENRNAIYSRCVELARAWHGSVMMASGSRQLSRPVIIPDLKSH